MLSKRSTIVIEKKIGEGSYGGAKMIKNKKLASPSPIFFPNSDCTSF
jgi:hypothetical protein